MPYGPRQGTCRHCGRVFTYTRRKHQDFCCSSHATSWRWQQPESSVWRADNARRAREQVQEQWKDPKFRRLRSRAQRELIYRLLSDPKSKFRTAPRHRRRLYIDRTGQRWEFKSETEREAAQWLDRQQLSWKYEQVLIRLKNGRTYVPDFWVEEWSGFIEIKTTYGAWAATGLAKVTRALNEGHRVWLVRPPICESLDALIS